MILCRLSWFFWVRWIGSAGSRQTSAVVALTGVFPALRDWRQPVPKMWNFCKADRCFGRIMSMAIWIDCSHVVLGLECSGADLSNSVQHWNNRHWLNCGCALIATEFCTSGSWLTQAVTSHWRGCNVCLFVHLLISSLQVTRCWQTGTWEKT